MPPRYLDPKLKWVWFLPTAVALVILWLITSLVLFFLSSDELAFGMQKPIFSFVLLIALALFAGVPIFAYNHLEFISFTYELTENEFIIRQGVITRLTTVIPYNRIQNINTSRTLLERLLGLASLQIETAGTNPSASEAVLPGVSKKDELISEITQKVEFIKKIKVNDGSNGGQLAKSELEVLGEILKELQALNKYISNSGSRSPAHGKIRTKWENVSPDFSGLSKDK